MTIPNGNAALRDVVSTLSDTYYASLEALCDRIDTHIIQQEKAGSFAAYFEPCTYLSAETKGFIVQRRAVFLPYLQELSEKSTTGHDCVNCSGKCDMQHTMRMLELTATLKTMQGTVAYIQTELGVLNKNVDDDSVLCWLKNEMGQLITMLNEFLNDEQRLLLPAIEQAQIDINAHS